VSIDEIGAEVGISGPGLYRHFANKQAMLAAMLVRISQTLLDEGRRRVEAAPTPTAALSSLIQWHVQFALTNPELIVVQDRDRSSLSTAGLDRVRTLQRRYIELWVDVGRQLDPQLPAPTARAAVQAVFGLINSTPHSARIDARKMARLLETMSFAALSAVSTGSVSTGTVSTDTVSTGTVSTRTVPTGTVPINTVSTAQSDRTGRGMTKA
jgi:AcrR family transcriptional regulator